MGTTITKRNYLVWLTILTVFAGTIVGVFIKVFLPGHYFHWYPSIPAYFYCFGWYYIMTFEYARRYKPNKILSVYIGMKVVKMLLSMILLLFYFVFVKEHREDFVLTFFLFYLFSITFESTFFYLFEHNLKKKKDKIEDESN